MLPSRKGQKGAAILIALLAALIIIYILFLPPADRAALLGEQGSTSGGPGTVGATNPTAIIYQSPVGTVNVANAPSQEHDLPSVPVRAITQGNVLASRDTAVVENNAFQKSPLTLVFGTSANLTHNAYLSMNLASITGGNLVVTLNGQDVYDQQPTTRTIPPIALTNLADTNTLTISASSVGFAFWQTNRITLSDIKVTADVTDLSAASVTQHLTIGQDELATMQDAVLSFAPVCNTEGPITVALDGTQLYAGTPDCSALNTLEVAPSHLVSGDNTITYSTTSADMIIDRGKLTTTGKKGTNGQFSFTIDPTAVAGHPILLRVYFASTSGHDGTVALNGNTMPLPGTGPTVEIPITTAVVPGSNAISFAAATQSFEIVRFEVVVG